MIKLFFLCSGVGIIDRGIETFFREAFDGLRGIKGLDLQLYKGDGEESVTEHMLWNLPRTGKAAKFLGKVIGRSSYTVEQLSTFPSMVRAIREHRPEVIFYSDNNLGFQLFRWRKQIGVPFRLLFSNGGPVDPPFPRTDFVHQVTPYHYDRAVAAGVSPEKQFMIPYGISVPEGNPEVTEETKRAVRTRLKLPLNRKIVLSVGWITAKQKRTDYLINEIAELPSPRPYLIMLGAMDEESRTIVDLARRKLGENNFMARSLPHAEVGEYYKAADLFAHASMSEGFGRVFLEALIHGLPVLAHDHPVMRFVLAEHAMLADLSKRGALATKLIDILPIENSQAAAAACRDSVRRRFSWPVLAPRYREMFYECMRNVRPAL